MLKKALYPVIFPKKITECSANFEEISTKEIFAATKYNVEKKLLKKILLIYKDEILTERFKDICYVNVKMVKGCLNVFYERNEIRRDYSDKKMEISALDDKSEYFLNFYELINFYFLKNKSYWERTIFNEPEELYQGIKDIAYDLNEAVDKTENDEKKWRMEDFISEVWDYFYADYDVINYIISGDIGGLMDVNRRKLSDAHISEAIWSDIEERLLKLHEIVDKEIPDEFLEYLDFDISCCRGRDDWDFCGYSQISCFNIPIAKEWMNYIKENDVEKDELCEKADYIISLLNSQCGFYHRTVFSPYDGWGYEFEDFDLRLVILFIESDLVFEKLNEKYHFSAKERKQHVQL